jgi:hypothetical protein
MGGVMKKRAWAAVIFIPMIFVLWGCGDIAVLAALKAEEAKASMLKAQWARTLTSASANGGAVFDSVAADSGGNIYAAGHQGGTGTFGFGNGASTTGTNSTDNVLIAKYDSSGQTQWAHTLASGSDQAGYYGVTVDAFGQVHGVGLIGSGAFGFGNSISATGSNASGNVLWVKYNPAGQALGALTLTSGTTYASFAGVAADPAGFSMCVVGWTTGTGQFGFGNSITATGTATQNTLLVKYNTSGSAAWADTLVSGTGSAWFYGVAVDSSGNIYASGGTNDTGTYGFGPGVSAAGTSSFGNTLLVKYNSLGQAQWTRTLTAGNGVASFTAVAVDSSNNVYAVGYAGGTGSYGFGNGVTATGTSTSSNPLLVKYNSSGQAQWAKTLTTGQGDSVFNGVVADSAGNVFVVGNMQGAGAYGFGNGVTAAGASTSGYNVLLVKYDASGNALWAQSTTQGNAISGYNGIAMDSFGNLFVVGSVMGAGPCGFGNGVTATGASTGFNVLVVKYSR